MLAKLLAGAGALALAAFAIWLFGNARFDAGKLSERDMWRNAAIAAERMRADERVADERRVTVAVGTYADRLGAIADSAVKSQISVREYAQTAAGRVQCLSAERVLGIDQAAAGLGLFTPSIAPSPSGSVQPDADRAQP